MITCGAKDKLSLAQIRPPYLVLCYNHMNSYYVRARELLPSLRSQPQGSAYLQRYLFLLSELLRLYHNWSKPHAILLEANITGKVPNELSAGGGICENVYQLMLQILSVCEADVKAKLAVITLKMFTSLCILQPSKFWPLCEPHIREALQPSAAVSLQVQGLTFIRDFLAEEDARVDLAAKLTADVETGKQIAQAERVSEEDGEEEEESEEEEYKAYRGKKKKTAALPSHDEDQNSGMATWVMQKFYQDIIQLCETSRWVLVRRRCLEVLQWSAQCGLLPPVKYLDVLIGLCGDVDPSLRPIALRCLRSLADRHEDAIASLFSRGLLKAYGVQHLCQVNLLQSAYVTDSMGLERSVYSPVIKLLHKKGRDNSMTSLLRLLYQESKARALWEDLGEDAAEEDVFRSKNPATLLAHIGTVIALTPFVLESDVLHVLQLCGEGIDYNGANMSDLLTQELNGGSQKLHTVTLHLSIGVVMLHYIQQTLKMDTG
ncbi:hypothetical protein AGDE_14180 [Angomonas deanei]|uniref:Sister chromatid cohesion protein n=1 Tax=Angomonas deanei TaxID=59799 RepID=A0A7G2CJE3_9TRYP|nr:hypothetical protein AGDE_14180 [Angomonas deanei]CAD2219519.1 Sister chromatid cohesion C-terminus, putative [Angomonas deanei]|eukprot:EPY21270.1 hypothetical protein AGDE_14180 [Angomonas deanei]